MISHTEAVTDVILAAERRRLTESLADNGGPPNGTGRRAGVNGPGFDLSIMAQRVSGGTRPSASVKLAPGGTALGYIVFEVPKAAKIKSVQFGTDSGFGETGEWRIG